MNIEHNWQAHCEAEPLAYSSAIQPHGGLLYLDANRCVSHVSAQFDAYSPYPAASLLDHPLPKELADALAPGLDKLSAEPGSRSELVAVSLADESSVDIVITQGNKDIIIEIVPHTESLISPAEYSVQMNTPQNSEQALLLHQEAATLIQQLTGFNRVMIYAFRDDGDGDVLAEARDIEVYGSYLGLRFPGSDIPSIARTLYLKNPWRLIPDSQAQPVPLLSLQQSSPDLTWSDLRSVSPVHMAYLNNMGVRASLSLPIVVARELWGLIACHHAEPRSLSLQVLRSASRNARHYSLAIASWQAASRMRFMDSLTSRFKAMRMILLRHGSILTAAADMAPILLEQLNACGLAIRFGDDWVYVGEVPAFNVLEQMDDWFESDCSEVIYSSDNLTLTHPYVGLLPVAGALALKLRTRGGDSVHLWLYRKELSSYVEWGGNPNKPVEYPDGEIDIAPRRSFEKWVDNRKGYSLGWQNEDRIVALHLRHLFMEIYG